MSGDVKKNFSSIINVKLYQYQEERIFLEYQTLWIANRDKQYIERFLIGTVYYFGRKKCLLRQHQESHLVVLNIPEIQYVNHLNFSLSYVNKTIFWN